MYKRYRSGCVIVHENLFQIRFRDGNIGDITFTECFEQSFDVAAVEKICGVVCLRQVTYDVGFFKMHIAVNGDAFCTGSGQGFDAVAGNDAAFPDDGGSCTVMLDFCQNVAGKEYGCALPVSLFQNIKKFPLHERIKSTRGFVQNQEFRRVLERADDCHFLAVAEGQFRYFARRVKLQAVTQDGGIFGTIPLPQIGGQFQHVFYPGIRIKYSFRG